MVNECTVRKWLSELANSLGLRDADGTLLHYTPHDFRRIFITDIVNAGFPIHLRQSWLATTTSKSRVATPPSTRRMFLTPTNGSSIPQTHPALRRVQDEPTQAEWDEFIEHFGQRKIALGNCHRPYGSDCVHEHACVRCDYCQIDPSPAGRLDEIRNNLRTQVEEAQRNQWLGDVAQLRITIEHADRKARKLRVRSDRNTDLVLAQSAR